MLTKLTLSADKNVVDAAKKLARKNRTSLSSMFVRFARAAIESDGKRNAAIAPITAKASGIVRFPSRKTDTGLLEDALAEKYGFGK